jgi:hypothetical protein
MHNVHCERCGSYLNPSKHHILPRHFFHGMGGIVWLCRDSCHNEIEKRITATEAVYSGSRARRFKLAPSEYREILRNFMAEIPCHH